MYRSVRGIPEENVQPAWTRFRRRAVNTWKGIISGKRKGGATDCARAVLRAGAFFYGGGVALRTRFYRAGLLKIHHAGLPVISVGNLTAGGTGKTPMVEYICRRLAEHGLKPAVIARGYGTRDESGLNDEAAELRDALPDITVVLDANRVRGVRAAAERGANVAVLDDGFQHLAIARDLDIVLVDATCPFGRGGLLPKGLLREPPEGLARADAVVITRADIVSPQALDEVRARVTKLAPGALLCVTSHQVVSVEWSHQREGSGGVEELVGVRVAAFCGIGNPGAFRATIERTGARLVAMTEFPDHHVFSQRELHAVARKAVEGEAEVILTTRKDAVRISADVHWPLPLGALRIEIAFLEGEERFLELLFNASGKP